MEKQELSRCLEFLDHFNIKIDDNFVYVTSGDTSCIMNINTQWKEFLGYSIYEVASAVADELNKEIKWIE